MWYALRRYRKGICASSTAGSSREPSCLPGASPSVPGSPFLFSCCPSRVSLGRAGAPPLPPSQFTWRPMRWAAGSLVSSWIGSGPGASSPGARESGPWSSSCAAGCRAYGSSMPYTACWAGRPRAGCRTWRTMPSSLAGSSATAGSLPASRRPVYPWARPCTGLLHSSGSRHWDGGRPMSSSASSWPPPRFRWCSLSSETIQDS